MRDWNAADNVSLDPLPWETLESLSERERNLQAIGDNIAYWLRFEIEQRNAENLETTPDTSIMLPGEPKPPHWPSVGQLKRWLLVLREGAASVDTLPKGQDPARGH